MSSKKTVSKSSQSKAVVPRQQKGTVRKDQETKLYAPEGYTMREIKPAKNYDVVSFAQAMNDDFGPRVKELFQPETDAALEAKRTGIYIGWRCPGYKHDCQRVGRLSKCFCGHILTEHAQYNNKSVRVPCKQPRCKCKGFDFIPSRPEDVGEFWLKKRRDFDPSTWRCKCKCKHTHEEHDPTGMRRCLSRGCGCSLFDSSCVCAACDKHTQEHETVFESASERLEKGFPVGDDYIPFAEIPKLKQLCLTGEEAADGEYLPLNYGPDSLPPMKALPPSGNDRPFGGPPSKGGFRQTYD